MNNSKVEFVANDPYLEANYICFLAKSIIKGNFQAGDFFVLPYVEKGHPKSVYFPDLGYSREFWRKIAVTKNDDLVDAFPKDCVDEVVSKLPKRKINHEKIVSDWRKIEKRFFGTINTIFADKIKDVKSIKFLITKYGTVGSFYPDNGIFYGTHRIDIHSDIIGNKIVYLFVKTIRPSSMEIGENEWYIKRAIVEFLIDATELRRILPHCKRYLDCKRQEKLQEDSYKYLKKLGFYKNEDIVEISQWGNITVCGKDIKSFFSKQEEKIFRVLVKNRGSVTTFLDFNTVPSLYALAKLIESMRRKIRNLGVNKEVITTVRGKGYVLV
jgi:hypothetical protein